MTKIGTVSRPYKIPRPPRSTSNKPTQPMPALNMGRGAYDTSGIPKSPKPKPR